MELHEDLAEYEFLFGVWRGRGHGHYPTVDSFDYVEEISFAPGPGKPFVHYSQRTRDPDEGRPLHTECGYLRPAGAGRAEFVLVSPTGILELHTGSVQGTHLHFRSALVERTPTAKSVTDVERHFEIDGDRLWYRLSMSAVGQPLQPHLEANLVREVPTPWDVSR